MPYYAWVHLDRPDVRRCDQSPGKPVFHNRGSARSCAQRDCPVVSARRFRRKSGDMTDSSRPTFKAHNVGDLFAMLPALFGFHPRESLVAITTYGERHRLGFRLRVDLPDGADVEAVVEQVAHYLRLQKPDGLVLLAISAHAEPAGELVHAVAAKMDDIPLIEAARGDGERFWSYLCDDQECCPSSGTRYGDRSSPVVADAIFRGESILPDRESLVRRFDGPSQQRKKTMQTLTAKAAREVERHRRQLDAGAFFGLGVQQLTAIFHRLDLGVDQEGSGQRRPTDQEMAQIMVWSSEIDVRDDVWSHISRTTANDWLSLLTCIAQHAVEPYEPALLSLAAFAAWLTGDGAQAMIAVERALSAEPDYSMACAMSGVISAGISPERWPGFDPANIEGVA